MRMRVAVLLGVMALLSSLWAPVASGSHLVEPFRQPGTSKFLDTWTNDCRRSGSQVTCVSSNLTAFSLAPAQLAVCLFTETTVFNTKTSRGRVTSSEDGCTGPIDPAVLTVTVTGTGLTTRLAPTGIALFECGRTKCRRTRVVTVSASGSGGPVQLVTDTGSFPDGTCYLETRRSGPVTGTLVVGRAIAADRGEAGTSEYVVQAC